MLAPVPANPGLFTLRFPGWSDLQGWSSPAAYSTILCADVDGDGQAEIMGLNGGQLQTYHFDRALGQWSRLADFQFPEGNLTIQAFDLDHDHQAELVITTNTLVAYVIPTLHFNSTAMTWSMDRFSPGPIGGPLEVACGSIGGVGQLFVRLDDGVWTIPYPPQLDDWPYFQGTPNGPLLTDAAGWGALPYASTMRCADLDGDGNSEVVIRGADGIHVFTFDATDGKWTPPVGDAANGPPLTDAAGWNQPAYYSTVQLADVDGDGTPELVASGPGGIYVFHHSGGAWTPGEATTPNGPTLSAATWQNPLYYPTITCADVDGDGRAEVVARGPSGIYTFDYDPATAAWTPDSDAGTANGPQWSDAAGWNQPQYSLTVRAADVNGDGRAEIMGRLADGVHTFATDGSQWADASAPFPPLQPGAYAGISTALGVANGQLRTVYGDEIGTLTAYQGELGNTDFLSGHDLDASWQPSVDQLYAEVTSVIAVQGLFARYGEYLLDVTLSDKISLDSVATAMELSQQVQKGSEPITADIFGLLSGIALSFTALVPEAPALAVLAGLTNSALAFAISLPTEDAVPINPVTETYEALNTQIGKSFNALRTANNANEATVLADYGLLMTIGRLIGSGQWAWPVDPTPDPETVTEAQYTSWAWQTLAAVAWTICDAIYIDGMSTPGDRSAPSRYDQTWFWWGPKTPTPDRPFSSTQHCRWLLLADDQNYAPLDPPVLDQLFGAPPDGLGLSAKDVLTGWALPFTPRG